MADDRHRGGRGRRPGGGLPARQHPRIGRGSDRDDALDVAVRRLAHLHNPYAARTNLGNPVSPLPGSLALAAPFVAAGRSAYQNLFWVGGFAVLGVALATRPNVALVSCRSSPTCG